MTSSRHTEETSIFLLFGGKILMQMAKLPGSKVLSCLLNAWSTRKRGQCDFSWNVNEAFASWAPKVAPFQVCFPPPPPLPCIYWNWGKLWGRVCLLDYHRCEGYFLRVTRLRNVSNFLFRVCLSPFCLCIEICSKAHLTPLVKETDLILLFPFAILRPRESLPSLTIIQKVRKWPRGSNAHLSMSLLVYLPY